MEQWKDVVGFEDYYKVSSSGRVYSKRSGKTLAQSKTGSGYFKVTLCVNGSHQYRMVHRLVIEAFLPNPLNKRTANHKDANKENNNLENLEWNTYSENIRHANRLGLRKPAHCYGETNPNCKLTANDVKRIREILASKKYFDREVADMFNVSRGAITYIKHNRSWQTV